MSKIWIKNGRVIDPITNFDKNADVLIENGKIVALEEGQHDASQAAVGERVYDAKGCWVVPGLVDIHTHLRDPGYEYKETIATGTLSAARGGFTSIVCMANTNPVNDNTAVTEYIYNKAKKEGRSHVFAVGAVTKGMKGEALSEFGDLKESGVVALSDDGFPVRSSRILRHALEYARNFDLPIISHCEDPELFHGGCMNEGLVSLQLGLPGIPNACEEIMVSRDIELSALTKGRLHLAHLSTAGSARLLAQAKDRGVPVTGEVTPHHLTLTDEAVRGYDANTKMNPPLRTEADRQALLSALRNGVFDAIASDHAPHSVDEKELEYDKAPFGIIGFETTVPLTLRLVHEKLLTPMQAIRLLTHGPATVMKLDAGHLKKGARADVVVIDPNEVRKFDRTKTASKSRNSPFHGWDLKGAVRYTFLAGDLVYEANAH